jgi:four helix bundle protein
MADWGKRVHTFRKLKVWQRAMDFVAEIYKLSAGFPRAEQFGLTSQIRRAASSMPLNIA